MIINNQSVSIIIPTFNRANYLPKAIDSCLNQTYECEIIVVDHGSTDSTPQVMEKYQGKVKYLRRNEDYGPHFCWLDGVINSNSEFIHIQYDDDWIKPTFIEECMKLISDEVGFVFTAAELFDEKKKKVVATLFLDNYRDGINCSKKVEPIVLNILISPGCIIIRKRDAIDALYQGNLPLSKYHYHGVGPDLFLTLICLLRYKSIGFVATPLAVFRVHDNSITIAASHDQNNKLLFKKAYAEVRDYYLVLKLYNQLLYLKIFTRFFWWKYFRYPQILLSKIINYKRRKLNEKNDSISN